MRTKPLSLSLSAGFLVLGCFQGGDFPGEQAEFVIDPVEAFDGQGLNKAIFVPFNVENLQGDLNNDGVQDDFAISTLLVLATDQEPADFCAQVGNPDFLNNLADVVTPGFIIGRQDQGPQAKGFEVGERLVGLGNNTPLTVLSFMFARQNNQDVIAAVSDGFGIADIVELDEERLLSAKLSDQLTFENVQEIDIKSSFDAVVLKAELCPELGAVVDAIFIN
jgi:hypothetical protein